MTTAVKVHGTAVARPARRSGFTLVEMFLAVAVLMMALGLAINLAQHERDRSQKAQTQATLRRLAAALDAYRSAHAGQSPAVPPLVSVGLDLSRRDKAEAELQRAAVANAAAITATLSPVDHHPLTVRDTWGNPIAYLPSQHPAIGMAADDRPFFVSPGPDRRFLTRDDNLYSYEDEAGRPSSATAP